MGEVENHYGQDTDRGGSRPVGPAPSAAGVRDRVATQLNAVAGKAAQAAGDVRDSVSGVVDQAAEWASDNYEAAARNARYARRRSLHEIGRRRRDVGHLVEENPIMVGVAGLAVGLLVGALLPGTRREDRYLGRYADEVRSQGFRYAQEIAEQGRQVLEEKVRGLTPETGRAEPRG